MEKTAHELYTLTNKTHRKGKRMITGYLGQRWNQRTQMRKVCIVLAVHASDVFLKPTSEREARLQGWRVNINAIFSTVFFFSEKVGQDKLQARSDAEQHPLSSEHTHPIWLSISFIRTAIPCM